MKNLLLVLFTLSTFAAFASNTNPITEGKTINTETSTVVWTGKKVTGSHTGTINIKSGNLDFEKGHLTGGEVVMDMTSLVCTDLKGGGAQKLVGHLSSDDFFGVPNHPTATFKITEVKPTTSNTTMITGDLTIKGQTHPVTFTATMGENNATATMTIDRTKYGIKYGSGSFFDNLGDKTIYDTFDLELNLNY